MGRPVGAHQTRPVQREPHRQALDRHVVHHLVVAALQEGRVDRRKGLQALARQPRRKGHRMLLGDADVEAPPGKPLRELVEPRPRRHRRRDRHHPLVPLRLGDQRLGEDRRCSSAPPPLLFACVPVTTSNFTTP